MHQQHQQHQQLANPFQTDLHFAINPHQNQTHQVHQHLTPLNITGREVTIAGQRNMETWPLMLNCNRKINFGNLMDMKSTSKEVGQISTTDDHETQHQYPGTTTVPISIPTGNSYRTMPTTMLLTTIAYSSCVTSDGSQQMEATMLSTKACLTTMTMSHE